MKLRSVELRNVADSVSDAALRRSSMKLRSVELRNIKTGAQTLITLIVLNEVAKCGASQSYNVIVARTFFDPQ